VDLVPHWRPPISSSTEQSSNRAKADTNGSEGVSPLFNLPDVDLVEDRSGPAHMYTCAYDKNTKSSHEP
jgi:hypothetical protein